MGASTAVFGAVGVLAGAEWLRRTLIRETRLRIMAPLLAAVNEYATLQEMMDVLREAWGVYEEPVIL